MAYLWKCHSPGGVTHFFHSSDEICSFLESENKRNKVVKATFYRSGHFRLLLYKTARKYYRLQFIALLASNRKLGSVINSRLSKIPKLLIYDHIGHLPF